MSNPVDTIQNLRSRYSKLSKKYNLPKLMMRNTKIQLRNKIDNALQDIQNAEQEEQALLFPNLNTNLLLNRTRISQIVRKDLRKVVQQQRQSSEEKFQDVISKIEDIVKRGNHAMVTRISNGKASFIKIINEAQIDSIVDQQDNSAGEIIDEQNMENSNFIIEELEQNPNGYKMVQRSINGQGNDLMNCQEIDNDQFYIPKSGNCLLNILIHNYPELETQLSQQIVKYCNDHNIYRQNIRYCDLPSISQIIGIKITYLRNSENKLKPRDPQFDILVIVIDEHFIQVKSQTYKQTIANIKQQLVWTEKQLIDANLNDIQFKTNACDNEFYRPDQRESNFRNCYAYDLEAYCDQNDRFQVYACGFGGLQQFDRDIKLKRDPLNKIKYTKGHDAIIQMLDILAQQHALKKQIKQIKKQKTEKTKKTKKTPKVTLYAHNGAKFDSYLVLQQTGIIFKKTIIKGGLMSLQGAYKGVTFKFIDSMKIIMGPLNKLCKSFKVPETLAKSSIEHNYTENSWKSNEHIWGPYLLRDISSLSWILRELFNKLFDITGINVNKSISIASYAKKYLDSCCGVQDSHADPIVRDFIRKSIKGGRVQCLKSKWCTPGFENMNFDTTKKVTEQQLRYLRETKNGLIPYDATSLYPSAMALENSIYPIIQSARQWDHQNDYLDCKKCYFIEIDFVVPQNCKFVPISYKCKDTGLAQFRTGLIKKQVINNVDYEEMLKFDIKVTKIYQGIIYDENQKSPYVNFIQQIYSERAKVKNSDPILGNLYKLIMNSCYGKTCEKEHLTTHQFIHEPEFNPATSQNRRLAYDEHVNSYQNLINGQVLAERNTYDSQEFAEYHMASLILSYSKRIMNDFVIKMDAHKQSKIYYMDTDSFYIHHSDFEKYLKTIPDCLGGGKNDYGEQELIVRARFIGSKQKLCYSVNLETGNITKHITLKGVQISNAFNKNLINENVVDSVEAGQTTQFQHHVWKREFSSGVQYCGEDQKQEFKKAAAGGRQGLKIFRNDAQLKKYNLQGNQYQYIHN